MLNHVYPYYPPEFKIYVQLIIHKDTNVNINDILENYSRYLPRGFFDFMSKYIDIPLQLKQLQLNVKKIKTFLNINLTLNMFQKLTYFHLV